MKKVQKSILMSLIILSIMSSLFLSGCKSQNMFNREDGSYLEKSSFSPSIEIKDMTFSSETEFENFIKSYSNSGSYRSYGGFGEVMLDMAIESSPMVKSTSSGTNQEFSESGSNEFSETNNQVSNVDEADIIKTDGDYIYTVSGNTLFIVHAYPGETAEVVSKTNFDNMPTSLFINGDYLAVFGNYYNNDFFKEMDFTPRQGMTYFNIYNIADKNNPKLLKEYKFEGNYFQARMVEDYVYFVTRSGMIYNGPHPMPIFIEGSDVKPVALKDIHYYPINYQYPEFANIYSIELTNPQEDINSKSIVVEGSQNMYMSQENMFITYTEYINEWDIRQEIVVGLVTPSLITSDNELIEKIKSTDNDILTQYEKEQKIYNIIQSYVNYLTQDERDSFEEEVESVLEETLEEYPYREYTLIHKVSVDNGKISIGANGKVPGHVINQFSMDEYDEVFRIATTLNPVWSNYEKESTKSTNNIFTLNNDLDILDELTGLAEDERIYSTRFIGERLYMVTFKQVDPFFVIDLSNPTDIKSLGELKIPGFSRYLHPYDEDTIIGIGRDATSSGRTEGLKISLFDVSDVSNPEEVAQFVTAEKHTQSIAEYEHKAFLFNKEKELLVIPAYNRNNYWRNEGGQSYNGAMVFKITKEDIKLRGIVDHSQGNDEYYGSMVERNLFIEELLYTKSPSLLRINKIDDLSSVAEIELVNDDGPIPIY